MEGRSSVTATVGVMRNRSNRLHAPTSRPSPGCRFPVPVFKVKMFACLAPGICQLVDPHAQPCYCATLAVPRSKDRGAEEQRERPLRAKRIFCVRGNDKRH